MTVRLPIIVLVAAILLSAATAFGLASLTQPASSDAAPSGSSDAIVSQLKKLNKKMSTGNGELTQINGELTEINNTVSNFPGIQGIYDSVHELCTSNPDTFALSC